MDPWDDLIRAVRAAGHHTQFRTAGGEKWLQCVEHRSDQGCLHGKQFQVIHDASGRWYVTVFGEKYYRLPEGKPIVALCLDLMRAMGPSLEIPAPVIARYGLIQTDDPCPIMESG
jgi:hypothetical protein